MCWTLSDGSSKLIPIAEQPNHQIVHPFPLGVEAMLDLQLIHAPDVHLDLLWMHGREYGMIHRSHLRCFFLSSLMTVVGLMCNTRAVSRIPLAFIAISTNGSVACLDASCHVGRYRSLGSGGNAGLA